VKTADLSSGSKECFLKAIDCYKNNKAWFHAAKAYEQVSKKKTKINRGDKEISYNKIRLDSNRIDKNIQIFFV